MKTIAIFGCSFTAGHGVSLRRWVNWPAEMARYTNDSYKIVNCARGGTSMLYSLHMLDTYLKNFPKPDLVLFQFTTDARISWISDFYGEQDYTQIFDYLKLKDFLEKQGSPTDKYGHLDNFYRLYPKENVPFGFMTGGGSIKGTEKLAKLYYKTVGRNLLTTTETDAMVGHVKTLCKDIPHLTMTHSKKLYSHKSKFFLDNIDLCFEEMLGTDYFKKSIIDEGKHISEKALEKLGKLMYNECKKRGYL
jgi:hypothetical protein